MRDRSFLFDLCAGALFLLACLSSLVNLVADDPARIAQATRRALATEWRAASDILARAEALLPPLTLPTPPIRDLDAPEKERPRP